jgi:hypothetical protein
MPLGQGDPHAGRCVPQRVYVRCAGPAMI